MDTYLTDEGMRSKYAILKSIASIQILESKAGVPVFVSGPHKEGKLDYHAVSEFGHYNPNFLKIVKKDLKKTLSNKKFVKKTQSLYDSKFKNMARAYYDAYYYVNMNAYLAPTADRYIESIEGGAPLDLQEVFRDYSQAMEQKGFSWYESNVAAGFWVRRHIDNTDKYFLDLITELVKTYDKEFIGQPEEEYR